MKFYLNLGNHHHKYGLIVLERKIGKLTLKNPLTKPKSREVINGLVAGY